MKYAYRRFDDYETFVTFLNHMPSGWVLQGWQYIGAMNDIRAIFVQERADMFTPLPEA